MFTTDTAVLAKRLHKKLDRIEEVIRGPKSLRFAWACFRASRMCAKLNRFPDFENDQNLISLDARLWELACYVKTRMS
nr:MAG TPA: FabL, FabH, KcsA bundle, C-terminus, IMMUNE SYSTEM.6A [Caudoviricetes sp.]